MVMAKGKIGGGNTTTSVNKPIPSAPNKSDNQTGSIEQGNTTDTVNKGGNSSASQDNANPTNKAQDGQNKAQNENDQRALANMADKLAPNSSGTASKMKLP